MSGSAAIDSALGVLAVTLSLPVVLALRARRLTNRIQSLARPLHELRGAMAALELGLTTMERAAEARPELTGWTEAFRAPLERASLGLRDLDNCRQGRRALAAAVLSGRVDLPAVVLKSVRAWSRVAPSYGARLQVDWRAGPVRVRGEAARLSQALDNLIANALEHGGGRVLVEGELQGESVRVKISDGGLGPPLSPARLAERQVRVARGHGIAIAYDVIMEHGGRLVAGLGRHGPGLVIELPAELSLEARAPGKAHWNRRPVASPAGAGTRAHNAA